MMDDGKLKLMIIVGIDEVSLLQAVETAVTMNQNGENWKGKLAMRKRGDNKWRNAGAKCYGKKGVGCIQNQMYH